MVFVSFKRVTPSARRVAGCEFISLRRFVANQNCILNFPGFPVITPRQLPWKPRMLFQAVSRMQRARHQAARSDERKQIRRGGVYMFYAKPAPSGYEEFLPE